MPNAIMAGNTIVFELAAMATAGVAFSGSMFQPK